MNTTLSFRRESIQSASASSEPKPQMPAAKQNVLGTRRDRDQWVPTLTTSLTTID